MTRTRSTRGARRLALAAMLLVTAGSTASAQLFPQPTQSQATVFTPGLPGQTMNVWVSVMGGNSVFGSDLVFFANGVFNPNLPFGGGQLILPIHPGGPTGNPWVAPANLTLLNGGPFLAGSELMFGLFVQPSTNGSNLPSYWVFSGDPNRNPDKVTKLNTWGNNVVFEDNRTTPFPGTPNANTVYGFEDDVARQVRTTPFGDFNDVLFNIQARVTPEPASMALLASGLAGLGGAGLFRRRRRA